MKYGEIYICKRYRLLSFLKSKGFLPETTLPDRDNPRYNVWLYQNSEELEKALEEYFEAAHNRA